MSLTNNIPPIYPDKLRGAAVNDPDSWTKASSYVSRRDYQTINSIAAGSGAISYIIDHAIRSTAEAIRTTGFTPVLDTPRFLQWLRERTFSEPAQTSQNEPGDDPGRVTSARQPATNVANVIASTGQDVKTGSRGGRGKTISSKT